MKNIKLKNNIIHIHQLGFPINLEIIIPKDDSVRTLYEVTEGLDFQNYMKRTLLKVEIQ